MIVLLGNGVIQYENMMRQRRAGHHDRGQALPKMRRLKATVRRDNSAVQILPASMLSKWDEF